MKAHLRYLSYVARHKWWVLVAGLRTGAPLWRLVIHDWSKFTPAEWGPYVAYFYGERERLKRTEADDYRYAVAVEPYERAFDRAWLHHQHANPHHWQHWTLREDSGAVKLLAMPEAFVREMVADWMGAGRAITGRWEVAEWYAKNREVIQLHPDTRPLVESLIAGAPHA